MMHCPMSISLPGHGWLLVQFLSSLTVPFVLISIPVPHVVLQPPQTNFPSTKSKNSDTQNTISHAIKQIDVFQKMKNAVL